MVYRMMRTPFAGAAGVALELWMYACVVTSHVDVVPSSGAGTTLAMIPGASTRAAVRSASRRWGALAYSWLAVRSEAMGAVPSRAPGGVATAAGDPAAESIAAKPSNTVDCSTPETV